MMEQSIFVAILMITGAYYWFARLPEWTYYAQRESYQSGGFYRHHFIRAITSDHGWQGVVSLVFLFAGLLNWWWMAIPAGFFMILHALYTGKVFRRKVWKVPLHWTARAWRLAITQGIVLVLEWMILCWWFPAGIMLAVWLSLWNVILALWLSWPLEWMIQHQFKHKAKTRLRELQVLHQLRVIGITGSYGKTSSKYILGSVLSAKFDVLFTPGSFNTPMGICRVINEQLSGHHEVFVAEMGARHRKDIQELVQLVEPSYGLITSVGPAHLETLGSLDNIAHTKFDLARGVSTEGIMVVNGDNIYCVKEAKTLSRDVLFYGFQAAQHLSAYAEQVCVEDRETAFTLVLVGDIKIRCKTRLLGRHNVQNIVGAALLARRMGLSPEELEQGIASIQPVEHRLQLIDPGTGILVIDDAFNSNPEGAAAALEVLSQFSSYRKWIVTPGMVELGSQSKEVHRAFGRQIAAVCDEVILVGKLNTQSLLAGLADAEFPVAQVHTFQSLGEAQKFLPSLLRAGDVVLFENDLPDHLEQ
ncbi:UDP-N-acetylmuramoyl-tripeptide--D-alanyl-D-alanine ligase [Alicyclobacillaceae bacterium I2511]|nr:UDP-N-acetylmuramoyl-tripeptide--D-alanyl-D-alanine ligase [Alicyclobacillaceae bacterium I2511]